MYSDEYGQDKPRKDNSGIKRSTPEVERAKLFISTLSAGAEALT